jgi:hypothetical protein
VWRWLCGRVGDWWLLVGSLVVYRKIFAVVILGLAGAFTLSGCGVLEQAKPLPDEKRYQRINDIKDNLTLTEVGEVVIERYDHGDGVFSPSFILTEVKGEDAFNKLTKSVKKMATRPCSPLTETQTRCDVDVVEVYLWKESVDGSSVSVKITDAYNGRKV